MGLRGASQVNGDDKEPYPVPTMPRGSILFAGLLRKLALRGSLFFRLLGEDMSMLRNSRSRAVVGVVLLIAMFPVAGVEALQARLQALAQSHDFDLQGLDKVGAETAVSATGNLAAQLRLLLAAYNHVVEGVAPSVQRVIILSAKQSVPHALVIKTTSHRGHQMVNARLQGLAGHRVTAALIVDTGASSLVLPDSMMAPLGFNDADLPQRQGQTVNGMVSGKTAQLASVSVGGAVARDVTVLFVADDRLGGVSLLGMSFLGRFSITMDEADSRLVLTPR